MKDSGASYMTSQRNKKKNPEGETSYSTPMNLFFQKDKGGMGLHYIKKTLKRPNKQKQHVDFSSRF